MQNLYASTYDVVLPPEQEAKTLAVWQNIMSAWDFWFEFGLTLPD
jgi:hypothetical protein